MSYTNRIIIFAIVLLSTGPLTGQSQHQRQDAISRFVNKPGLASASIGIAIIDIHTDETIAEYSSRQSLVPASVLKLITTATALELYGPDFRFETRLSYSGYIDQKGILQGNLYITGSGDPTLGSAYSQLPANSFIQQGVAALIHKKIKGINGHIIADASAFNTEGVSHKWLWEDLGNYFAAGAYGLNFQDNMYQLVLKSGSPGTTPTIIKTVPLIPGLTFRNHLVSATNERDSAYIYGAPFSPERSVYGSIPSNRSQFTVKGDIPDPALFLAQKLKDGLTQSGIKTTQEVIAEYSNSEKYALTEKREILLSFQSDKLSNIVRIVNERSNNLYAEALLRLIARKRDKTGSAAGGVAVILDYWKKKGLDLTGLFMYDGSGLSPVNKIPASLLCKILARAATSEDSGQLFKQTIPLVGQEGTVRNLLKGSNLVGKVRLKSGSMAQIQCYAGFYTVQSKEYAITVIVNNFTLSRNELRKDIEQLLIGLLH